MSKVYYYRESNKPLAQALRREMTREMFEDLAALQCTQEEILGYVGTTEKKLEAWCRKTYRRSLKEMMGMIRQDGLIAIRRAGFDQLKKSATLVTQQYNRFLSGAGRDPGEETELALRSLAEAMTPSGEDLRGLFDGTGEENA